MATNDDTDQNNSEDSRMTTKTILECPFISIAVSHRAREEKGFNKETKTERWATVRDLKEYYLVDLFNAKKCIPTMRDLMAADLFVLTCAIFRI